MCGIVGYVGSREAVPLLMAGLTNLEYRGYDSAGIAAFDGTGLIVQKCVGRLSALGERLKNEPVEGRVGIGHTRWATHGEPSEINSHPHLDCTGRIAVVHNGIIENYQELRAALEAKGHQFISQTDTEVIPHLIEAALSDGAKSFEEALQTALKLARGAYALGILFKDQPDRFYAARHGSPLVVGVGKGEQFIASDVPAIVSQTRDVIYLNDGEIATLTPDGVRVTNLDGQEVKHEIVTVTLRAESVERAGFETFMLKEIHEQPRVLRNLLDKHVSPDSSVLMPGFGLSPQYFKKLNRVMIVSCGTAYHAGMYGKLLLENLTRIAVETDLGSEFRYRDPKIDPGTLIVAVSQSGETADTL
ncbi:MAG TPA: glutamine--fructose-6-phosphate transaminase (isomerizing), partial [Verrucomicrobia bacterium]|nr:glutamine--fructose-6-phosphate transaminase (isomerizing) [Verrucomicrobiota bacterium]